LPLEFVERVDYLCRLERAIPPSNPNLAKNFGLDQVTDSFVCRDEAAVNESGGGRDCEYRGTWQNVNEEIRRGSFSNPPELFPPFHLERSYSLLKKTSVLYGATARGSEKCQPLIPSVPSSLSGRVAYVTSSHKSFDVLARQGCQDQRHRGKYSRDQPAAAKDHMNESSAGASIAVDKRMDRFKLRMCNCGLRDTGKIVLVAEGTEVLKKVGHLIRRWRDVIGIARVVVPAPNPVLPISDHSALGLESSSGHEPAVHIDQVGRFDRGYGITEFDRPSHGVNVPENFLGRYVT
jgi:hypothetical protein